MELSPRDREQAAPNRTCAAANLHREALIVEPDEVGEIWSIGAAGPGG